MILFLQTTFKRHVLSVAFQMSMETLLLLLWLTLRWVLTDGSTYWGPYWDLKGIIQLDRQTICLWTSFLFYISVGEKLRNNLFWNVVFAIYFILPTPCTPRTSGWNSRTIWNYPHTLSHAHTHTHTVTFHHHAGIHSHRQTITVTHTQALCVCMGVSVTGFCCYT